jgi:hypothetical protein
MTTTSELLIDVLLHLVESVADQPKRVLFKGASDLDEAFRQQVAARGLSWDVCTTRAGVDVVGARNDASIGTLVVFYRDEVRERESLNAFRQFDEAAIAEALVRYVTVSDSASTVYSATDVERLRSLLTLAYPSVERLAEFLLVGKAGVGKSLPLLGLFADPGLHYGLREQDWQARLRENHAAAVIRWREFLEKGQRNRDARTLLGVERIALLHRAEADPAVKQTVLEQVTQAEALRVLNPPTRTVERLMLAGLTRERAEWLEGEVKTGRVKPRALPPDVPALPEDLVRLLERIAKPPDDGPVQESTRVTFCLEGLLRLARQRDAFPGRFRLARADSDSEDYVEFLWAGGKWTTTATPNAMRTLSVPTEGADELLFSVTAVDRQEASFHFSLTNLTKRLEPYAESWPEPTFWDRSAGIDPQYGPLWRRLQDLVGRLRDAVDPEWNNEQPEEDTQPNREPNNPIYMLFDLLYLTQRELFESFLDAWVAVATLPWRAKVTAHPDLWLEAIMGLLQIGLAERSDGSVAVLPFHPVRLAWHRAVFVEIERWLGGAAASTRPLEFDLDVLSLQLQAVDRPRALIYKGKRLVEALTGTFFSIMVPESGRRRVRAPLDRAQLKVEQFGRMWPFSLARLHLAFQPGEASDDVLRLLTQQAEAEPDAAFRVRAIVESTGTVTAFDRALLTTGDESTDLLTEEYHEGLLPRVDYAKGPLEGGGDGEQEPIAVHVALLVDAFREEDWGFAPVVGRLDSHPHWSAFGEFARADTETARTQLTIVSLSALPYHTGPVQKGRRDLVYVPLAGDRPEYMRLLWDSLCAWAKNGSFTEGAYYERVLWDARRLEQLHHQADWVILMDRTLDKSLFRTLAAEKVKLIDFYPSLPGGYRLSVSSRRVEAVEWQLVQVLQQFFGHDLDLRRVAREMLETLAEFASGLLLKTLGGGSLAQELLGLYATYKALIAEHRLVPGHDWLIPLDDYQHWFGRRTQRGRRADLLVLRTPAPNRLEMLAVESKWYKQAVSAGFVEDEFGPGGQLRTAVVSLRSLFDPRQDRLDRDYWRKTLSSLIEDAPPRWTQFRQSLGDTQWELVVDGRVYVHQYTEQDAASLSQREQELQMEVAKRISPQGDGLYFGLPNFQRLRLESYPGLVELLRGASY